MALPFTWAVYAVSSGGGEFITSKAQFGDGYSQEFPLGLNNEVQNWSVSISDYSANLVSGPLGFIRSVKGASFLWTPPLGVQGLYRCKKYNLADQGGDYITLSMEFQQVFQP